MKHAPRSRFPWSGAFVAALVLLASGPALAQREGTSYLSYVGTEVSLVSTNEDDTTARLNMPILAGDRLSTGAGSRAEAVLADGNILRFDTRTDVRFDRLANTYQTEDERTLLFLESGALAIDVRFAASRENAPRIDTNDATIVLADRAYVRIDAGRRGTEVYVESGRAEVFGRSGRVLVKAGEYAYVSGSAEVEVDVSAFPRDRFTRFCEERRDRRAPSTRYVSSDYDYEYTDAGFEDYGSWTYVSSWGRNCWRPRVHSGWLPYTSGYWRYSPHGMTWVSYEPWGWLPYHYGTWGYDVGAGWCWIPGASYSPAWVYWSYAPGWVGWCPMGYYGGYYDHYYRSTRPLWGNDGRGWGYAHLSGRVQVGRIDNHGWSYTPTSRLGRRFDVNRDVVRFERTGLTRNDYATIATAPLRIERGTSGSAAGAIQDAVRRIPLGSERGTGGTGDALGQILRRERNLTPDAEAELRRGVVRTGADRSYRPMPAETLGRRFDPNQAPTDGGSRRGDGEGAFRGGSSSGAPSTTGRGDRGEPYRDSGGVTRSDTGRDPWRDGTRGDTPRIDPGNRDSGGPNRDGGVSRGDTASPRPSRGDDSWRSGSGTSSGSPSSDRGDRERGDRGSSGTSTFTPRGEGADGWRAPSSAPRRDPAPEGRPRGEGSVDSWRGGSPTESAPRRERETAPPPPSPRESRGDTRGDAYSRGGSAPSTREPAPAPRSETREAPAPRRSEPRSYDAPRAEPRTYEVPRPEPRRESPPSRSYEPAPAPRYEAPPPPPRQESAPAPSRDSSPRSREGRG